MPYLKFSTKQEEDLAWDIVDTLLENSGKVTGLVARVNTPKHGLISFFSEEPYMAAIKKSGISYTTISKDEISHLLIDILRKSHPEYANEL